MRGKAAVDVLPDVLTGLLRDLHVPEADALGRACSTTARASCRSAGRFAGSCSSTAAASCRSRSFARRAAQGPLVQEVRSGAVTFGHRFLTTSGRAGRAIKVKGFDDYRKRLAENFVVLERSERQDRIARELDVEARRRGGRVARQPVGQSLLHEVPGSRRVSDGRLGRVRRGVPLAAGGSADDDDDSPSALLSGGERPGAAAAGVPRRPQHGGDKPELIVAQPRARADGAAARRALLLGRRSRAAARGASAAPRHRPVPQEAGQLRARRPSGSSALARWIATDVLGSRESRRDAARGRPARKADLATDMVREMTELQGTMGGIYAREGRPARSGLEGDLPPLPAGRRRSRCAADARASWARGASPGRPCRWPTSSTPSSACSRRASGRPGRAIRTACAARRRASCGMLIDLPELTGHRRRALTLGELVDAGAAACTARGRAERKRRSSTFLVDRVRYVLEQRGFDVRNVRAVTSGDRPASIAPLQARRKLEVLPEFTRVAGLQQLAHRSSSACGTSRGTSTTAASRRPTAADSLDACSSRPAEVALLAEIEARQPAIEAAVARGHAASRQAFAEAASFGPGGREVLRRRAGDGRGSRAAEARLRLMKRLETLDSCSSPTSPKSFRREVAGEDRRVGRACRVANRETRRRTQEWPKARGEEVRRKKSASEASTAGEAPRRRSQPEVRVFLRQRQGRRRSHDEGHARRQGRGPRRDDQRRPAGAARVHDLHRRLQPLLRASAAS